MRDPRQHWPALLIEHTEMRDRLIEAYDGPGRPYHDTRHLGEVFGRVDVLLEADPRPGIDRDAVLLAAWFHDAVYDTARAPTQPARAPTQPGNEERSAALAERELAAAGAPAPLVEEVARLVRLTETHQPTGGDRAGQVLCDADLGILAADEERYEEYLRDVRTEYAAVPDADFRAGRAQVLRRLVDSPTLFSTTFARQHWEERARRNVARELATLEGAAEER